MMVAAGPVLHALDLGFERTWGGVNDDAAEGVAVAPDGSVYTTGTTLSFGAGDRDIFLLKYTADGTLVWQRTWGTAPVEPFLRADDFATDVAVASDGSVYVTGFSGNDAFLLKFDGSGTLLWQKTWGGQQTDFAEGVATAPDGSVYVTGATDGFGDAFLVRFSPEGGLVWQKTWGGLGLDYAHDVAVAADGSIYIGGETNSFFANDAFLAKFDPNGVLVWDRAWRDGTIQDISGAFGVAVAPDGSVYLAGNAARDGIGQDIFLVKFTPSGALAWEKTWGDKLSAAHGVAVAADGTVFVTGNTGFGQGNGDAFVLHVLANGRPKDAHTWGGLDNDTGQSIAAAPDGSAYVAGIVGAPEYVFDRARKTMKRPDGFLDTPNGAVAVASGVVGDAAGVVLVPEGSETYAGGMEAALIKVVR
jgi:uncharacterized delta-60 repeat protein